MYTIKGVLILDNDGERVLSKVSLYLYYVFKPF